MTSVWIWGWARIVRMIYDWDMEHWRLGGLGLGV